MLKTAIGNILSMEMTPRRRPIVSDCGALLHGVVRVPNEGIIRAKPLAGARVRVAVEGGGEATATSRRDGSYSVVVGSCRKRKRAIADQLQLHVFYSTPCVEWNATRIVRLDTGSFDERAVWKHDVHLHAKEARRLCEVVDKTPIGGVVEPYFRLELKSDDVYQAAEGLAKILVLAWGLVVLWAVAVWVSNNQPRRTTRTHQIEPGDDTQSEEDPVERGYPRAREIRGRRQRCAVKQQLIQDDSERSSRTHSSNSTVQSREKKHPLRRRVIRTVDEDNMESD